MHTPSDTRHDTTREYPPQSPDPVLVARIVNVAWHVRRVLDDWYSGSAVAYDDAWFAQHRAAGTAL